MLQLQCIALRIEVEACRRLIKLEKAEKSKDVPQSVFNYIYSNGSSAQDNAVMGQKSCFDRILNQVSRMFLIDVSVNLSGILGRH